MASVTTAAARPEAPARARYERADETRAHAGFLRSCPPFRTTRRLDELRATEYRRLDQTGQVYLDYAGAGLHAESQLEDHLELLRRRVLGNPHSDSPASAAASELVERARRAVLRHFNASPAEYAVIFTANATGALKLVGEGYPFGGGSQFVLTSDNHNSVNGIREFARAAGATVTYVPGATPSLRVDEELLEWRLRSADRTHANLFAYPAQSNFSGVQHPLEWIPRARADGWAVLVDGAAFVPTNRLDLSEWQPDFVPVSLYKLLGYPTGVGCLVARREALAGLRRPWFAGGTIATVSVHGDWHTMADGEARFEDGTLNYLALPAVEQGLALVDGIGIGTIHTRVSCLTEWLLDELGALRHANGRAAVQLYGPRTTDRRGGTITFNLVWPDGRLVDIRIVEREAAARRISLRTGCFCNPGASELAFGIPLTDLHRPSGSEGSYEYLRALGFESGGAVRVSLGPVTTFADVYRFMRFVAGFAA
jgi:selenocysteine lyase/cysteine desulfurase